MLRFIAAGRLVDLGVAWQVKHGVRKFAVADRAGGTQVLP